MVLTDTDRRIRRLEMRSPELDPDWLVEFLVENNYNLLVTGPTDGSGYALFPSKIFPLHPKTNPDMVERIVKGCHAHDIKIISWLCFNIENVEEVDDYLPAKLHPDWMMRFINPAEDGTVDSVAMCPFSSPYREMYASFIEEVAQFGYDGFWFDGTRGSGLPNTKRAGCVCDFCAEKFKNETGLDLPREIDWSDVTFKRWIVWRYDKFIETAEYFTEKIKKISSDATVNFSTANRPGAPPGWELNWEYAVPMRRFKNFHASEHSGMEPTNGLQLLPFHSKLARAHHSQGADIWTPTTSARQDFHESNLPPHVLNMRLHYLGSCAHGVLPWCNYSGHSDHSQLKKLNDDLALREPYCGGKDIKYCGLHISQATRDFYGNALDKLDWYSEGLWGAYSILAQEHIQHNFIFDDDIEEGLLDEYGVIILPNSVCLSDNAIAQLQRYVHSGGTLICWYMPGCLDELGEQRGAYPLLSWLGVEPGDVYEADKVVIGPVVVLGERFSDIGFKLVQLDGPHLIFELNSENEAETHGFVAKSRTEDGQVIDFHQFGQNYVVDSSKFEKPTMAYKRFGKGEAFYFGGNVGLSYYQWPHNETRKFLSALINLKPEPVKVTAPTVVISNTFLKDDMLIVHLLNLPPGSNRVSGQNQRTIVDELLPIYDIEVELRGYKTTSAKALHSDTELKLKTLPGGTFKIIVPKLVEHEMIIFALK